MPKRKQKIAKFIRMKRTTSNVIYPLYSARVSFHGSSFAKQNGTTIFRHFAQLFDRNTKWETKTSRVNYQTLQILTTNLSQSAQCEPLRSPPPPPKHTRLALYLSQTLSHNSYACALIHVCHSNTFLSQTPHASISPSHGLLRTTDAR